ncbi:MAG: TlpA family protein disulfide reductase [Paludibacter sp.]|nr:TlpA family protein disulfide reductase [Paludibacter sp.]
MRATIVIACILFAYFVTTAQNVKNFEFKDLENKSRSFNELKGEKLTLIDFWATWCKPCNKAIPELNKIYDIYKSRGVEIIGINCDGPRSISKVAPLSKSLQIKYPVLIDINSELKAELNVLVFPTLLIVNSKGKVVWIHEGYVSGDNKIIISEIEKLLKGT